MDAASLMLVLSRTLDPSQREGAEKQLEEVSRVAEFTPCLLQIVLDNVDRAVRQAAAIYLKNMIMKYWRVREAVEGAAPPYSIPDNVKEVIRGNVVEAIIQTPGVVGHQLSTCLEHIIKLDYPDKWTGVVDKVHSFLSSDNQAYWLGALLSLYQLAKKYKFKKDAEERMPFVQPMKTLLPLLLQRQEALIPNDTEESAKLQHWILKILSTTLQYSLPLELLNDTTMPGWMAVMESVVSRPTPPECRKVPEEEQLNTEWWKAKKWATRVLWRIFEHYGNPNTMVDDDYQGFAQYYEKMFSVGVMQCLLNQLELVRQGQYMSPRVLQIIFNYLEQAIHHTPSWTIMKPQFGLLYQEVMFPLMCYDDEDDQLWKEDPQEYIRMKYDVFEDLISPIMAAVTVIHQTAKHRKGMLDQIVAHCIHILMLPAEQRNPRMKDGALHILGILANLLMKKQKYKGQLETMLVQHVVPEFQSPHGYLRARACWMLHHFCDVKFQNQDSVRHLTEQVFHLLLQDSELPVKVDAALALQFLVKYQLLSRDLVKPQVKPIIEELLKMIRECEDDDITGVLEFLIRTYTTEIGDVALDLCVHLASVFMNVCYAATSGEDDGYKALTAVGLLSAIQTLVKAACDNQPLLDKMEASLVPLISAIFEKGIMDFYEEILSMVELLTANQVSPNMWKLLSILYTVFESEGGYDFFGEICPVMYNYITTDTSSFLSNPKHVEVVIAMCRQMLTTDPGDSEECYACKLLEVLIIHCHHSLIQWYPAILQLVLERLTKVQKAIEVRLLCEVVVLSAIYCNPPLTLNLMEQIRFPGSPEAITEQFFSRLLEDTEHFEGIHDRKIAALALCSVMTCQVRPPCIVKLAGQILPRIASLLKALVKAYEEAAEAEKESSDDEDGDSEEEDEEEEEEDVDDEECLKKLREKAVQALKQFADEEETFSYSETLMLEVDFETLIDDAESGVDEYVVFRETMAALSMHDPQWYAHFTSQLTPVHTQLVQELLTIAAHRKQYRESKEIEKSGGYQFTIVQMPNTFAFGGGNVPPSFK